MSPIIELFRGVGAWMVLTCHYARFFEPYQYILKFLWTGVFLFFVISGYVFGRLIYCGQVNGISYGLKRFFRIYPLYLVSLIAYYFLIPDNPNKLLSFIKHLFFLNTTNSMQEAFLFNPAYWTLPVEVEFYILIPVLIYLREKMGENIIYLILIASLIAKMIIAFNSEGTPDSVFTILNVHILSMFPEFGVGILLYKLTQIEFFEKKCCLVSFFVFGSLLISFCAVYFIKYGDKCIFDNLFLRAYFSTLCALGYALILFAMLKLCKPSINLTKICLNIGATSYGVYLFHNLIPHLFNRFGWSLQVGARAYIIASCLTLCIALLVNKFIETPFRAYGRNLARVRIEGQKKPGADMR